MRSDPGDLTTDQSPGAASASPASKKEPDATLFLIRLTKIVVGFLALGLAAILLYSLQDIHHFFSVSTTGLLLAFAALALGLLAGFIFGIPSTPKVEPHAVSPTAPGAGPGGTEAAQPGREVEDLTDYRPYRPNTNMEKISDWLATILVGIGLTQILKLPAALEAFGNKLKPALGNTDAAGWLAVGVLLVYAITGFLLAFLWTRVKLPELYAQSDLRQRMLIVRAQGREAGRAEGIPQGELRMADFLAQGKAAGRAEGLREGIPQGERLSVEAMALPQEPTAEALTPKGLEPSVREAAPVVKHILWVDDHPDNNRSLRQLMAARLNVEFEICLYTSEALRKLNPSIDLVISDMSRPVEGDPQAGITLLQELKRHEYNKPYLIYASRILPDQEQRFKALGGYAAISSPVQLMALVEQVLKS